MDNEKKLDGDYTYVNAGNWGNDYLVNPLIQILNRSNLTDKRLFEVGFGNGWTANHLTQKGYQVTGIEPSNSGVKIAKKAYPSLNLHSGNVYQNLSSQYGQFPVVYSLEVIEHCQFPRKFIQTVYDLLETNGKAIISTPYHGYIKNLLIALFNKTDSHFDPRWDDGHLRFFSVNTLTALLTDAGFKRISFEMTGRFGPISKSMIAIAHKS